MAERPRINVRLTQGQVDWVEQLASEYHLTKTDVFQMALALARDHRDLLVQRLELIKGWE